MNAREFLRVRIVVCCLLALVATGCASGGELVVEADASTSPALEDAAVSQSGHSASDPSPVRPPVPEPEASTPEVSAPEPPARPEECRQRTRPYWPDEDEDVAGVPRLTEAERDALVEYLRNIIFAWQDHQRMAVLYDGLLPVLMQPLSARGTREHDGHTVSRPRVIPIGLDVETLTPEDLALWRKRAERVIPFLEAEVATYRRVEAALDASAYRLQLLDEIEQAFREYLDAEVAAHRDLLAMVQTSGPEALASKEAMERVACWLWSDITKEDKTELREGLLRRVPRTLVGLLDRAVRNVGFPL